MNHLCSIILLVVIAFSASGQDTVTESNLKLTQQLENIFFEDQYYRLMLDSVEQCYGYVSKEIQQLWETIHEKDSVNIIKVRNIIDKHGWLGPGEVGEEGNMALFLIIQHADLNTQEKYLPVMQEAVKDGKARGADLALLIDRIEMYNGRPQVYGSQITVVDGEFVLYPIIDEVNVNARRREVGLPPLEEYLKNFNIVYKLPAK